MSEAEFSIHTPTDDVLTLDQAVLLYHGRSGGALATVHEILTVDGAPVIGAGVAVTRRGLDPHGAEFDDAERDPVLADARLGEENRPAVLQPDGGGGQKHYR